MSVEETCHISTASPEETFALGERIGAQLWQGLTIGLVGQLGTGKTALVKGVAKGNGLVDGQCVTSPTFKLINEYEGRVLVYHLDAYRLKSSGELTALGFDEMTAGDAAVIVEWADLVRSVLPEKMVWIEIETSGELSRGSRIRGYGERACAFVREMRKA